MPELGRLDSELLGARPTGPAGTLILFALLAMAVVLCAACSYYLLERPLLRFKGAFRRSPARDGGGRVSPSPHHAATVDVLAPVTESP